jgi:hypothetical protein
LQYDRFDFNYNPWGQGPDAVAMKAAFEQRFDTNLDDAKSEFSNLNQKAYGYRFTEIGTNTAGGSGRDTFDAAAKYGDPEESVGTTFGRANPNDPSIAPRIGAGGFGRLGGGGPDAMVQEAELAAIRGDQQITVDPEPLTPQEEYMLYRYERRAAITSTPAGMGEIDYDYASDIGVTQISKAGQSSFVQLGAPQLGGSQVTRAERAAGKQNFRRPTGAQL